MSNQGSPNNYKSSEATFLEKFLNVLKNSNGSPYSKYRNEGISKFKNLLEQKAIDHKREDLAPLLNDLQASILKSHKRTNVAYHFLSFNKGKRPQAFDLMDRLSTHITTAKEQLDPSKKNKNAPILTLFLTYQGYQYFDIPNNILPSGNAFQMNIKERLLLDTSHFQEEYQEGKNIHAVLCFAYNDGLEKKLKEDNDLYYEGLVWKFLDEKKANLDPILRYQPPVQYGTSDNPFDEFLHFADGMSNPKFFPGAFPSSKKTALSPKHIGSLDLVLRHDKGGNNSFSCGSFGAFLKLEINEEAIADLMNNIMAINKKDDDFALANILGRFRDGTPLTLFEKSGHPLANDFNFKEVVPITDTKAVQDDSNGSRCPFHTHIRKSNPRTEESNAKRIVRRGMFYDEGKKGKGLLFLSFQNSLEEQFEYILNSWMLNDSSEQMSEEEKKQFIKTGVDILFSQPGEVYEIPTTWNQAPDVKKQTVTINTAMVTLKGGLYFFAPSISFFKKLKNYNIEWLTDFEIQGGGKGMVSKATGKIGRSSAKSKKTIEPEFIAGTTMKVRKHRKDKNTDLTTRFIEESNVQIG